MRVVVVVPVGMIVVVVIANLVEDESADQIDGQPANGNDHRFLVTNRS